MLTRTAEKLMNRKKRKLVKWLLAIQPTDWLLRRRKRKIAVDRYSSKKKLMLCVGKGVGKERRERRRKKVTVRPSD